MTDQTQPKADAKPAPAQGQSGPAPKPQPPAGKTGARPKLTAVKGGSDGTPAKGQSGPAPTPAGKKAPATGAQGSQGKDAEPKAQAEGKSAAQGKEKAEPVRYDHCPECGYGYPKPRAKRTCQSDAACKRRQENPTPELTARLAADKNAAAAS